MPILLAFLSQALATSRGRGSREPALVYTCSSFSMSLV